MISGQGRGSNMAALIAACASGEIPGRVAVVIGTRADAPALARAKEAGVATVVHSPKKYVDNPEGYADVLLETLRRHEVQVICLAGYLRRLPSKVVARYAGRILNVHPSLLPLFGGQGMFGEHVHRAAIESGMKFSGCTIHFVDEDYDTGPIVTQRVVPILDDDTPHTLAARILPEEHSAYVQAVRWFAEGRLQREGNRVVLRPDPGERS
jgi:formyltetrahydrofolate-dependent phosphoribosylglycinamide formyltransferase